MIFLLPIRYWINYMSQMPVLFKKSLTKIQEIEYTKKSAKRKQLPVKSPKVCWLLDVKKKLNIST